MQCLHTSFTVWALALSFAVVSCLSNSDSNDKGEDTNHKSSGTFLVSLVTLPDNDGYTSVEGIVKTGASPKLVLWNEVAKNGSCRLLTPETPSCIPACGSGFVCIAKDQCIEDPTPINAGNVSITGLATTSGKSSFALVFYPLMKNYRVPAETSVKFPPFAEGDNVTLSASGDTGISAFTVSVKGISPLKVLNDSISLEDGKQVNLQWTPATIAGASTISVVVDLSHHGTSKGKIECEGADNGQMVIAANLVDGLKALGISGYPKADISRKAIGTNGTVGVDLVLESQVTKFLSIPGLISCSSSDECPVGQECQQDMQCK